MQKYHPKEVQTKLISAAYAALELPNVNQPVTQNELAQLYIANMMISIGNSKKKEIVDQYKSTYGPEIKNAGLNDKFELISVQPFTMLCKVSSPRNSFDKDEFIKKIAEKYDLSLIELNAIAKTTVKQSAAPVSFEVVCND